MGVAVFFTIAFASVALVLTVLIQFIIDDLDCDANPYNPMVYWRKMNTPSCRNCKHSDNIPKKNGGSRYYCVCPDAIEAFERIDGTVYDGIISEKVRGRKFCKFESTVIEDNKEEKE